MPRWPVYVALGLVVVFSVILVIEFAGLSGGEAGGLIPEDDLTAESYMDAVEPLLADADPSRAPALINSTEHICATCHLGEANIAPSFDNVADVAGERKPPLQAAAYIYESILHPGAYVVEGYSVNNMPRNYGEKLGDQELGDIIAWLLLTPQERAALPAASDVQ